MFKSKDELYHLEFPDKPDKIVISERKIILPKMPDESEMINYHLATKDQKFVRRTIPEDIHLWDRRDIDKYVEAEWHRRLNGYWILIKGEPFYITGTLDRFVNYWTCDWGGRPEWRHPAWEWHLFWWDVERDPNCFGMINPKPRRVGSTENALHAVHDRTTRFRNFNAGIVHINEDGALKNFRRLVKGNAGMPFFFKPYNIGTQNPKGGSLEFDIPSDRVTKKGIKEGKFHASNEKGLESGIYVEPAVTGVFDGERLGTYYSDEIFKVKSNKFDILRQWKNMRKVLSLFNEAKIVGKAIKTSSIEEVEDGRTIEIARKMFDDARNYDKHGRSLNGLALLFQDYTKAAQCDEWGFPKVKEAKKRRDAKLAKYRKEKRYDDILDIKRKEPASLEEALSAPLGECILYPEMCDERLRQLREGVDRYGQPQKPRGEYGDLEWTAGIMSNVKWIPGGEKKYFISQHPRRPNKKMSVKGKPYPMNMDLYRAGLDTYEASEVDGKGSDGALVIDIMPNMDLEPKEIKLDENGDPINVEDMMTGQPVCDYKYRPDDVYEAYSDYLKALVYYGVAAHMETNKPGFKNWCITNGFDHYIQEQPQILRASTSRVKGRKGTPATPAQINQWITSLKLDIYKYVWCNFHPRLLEDYKIFTKKTRTLRDLSVASGYSKTARLDLHSYNTEEEEDDWDYPLDRY